MVKNFLNKSANLLFRRQRSILSAATVLMITYAASMVLGILRERVLVANFYFCCRDLLDVYYAAFRLPDMLFQLVVIGALSASFIPVFSEELVKDEKTAYRVSSSLINILMIVYLVLAAIIFVFAQKFSSLITGGFSKVQIELMANMTRVMLLAQGFFLISNFLTAIIQSHQRFIVPAIAPLFYNLGIIFSVILLTPFLGIWAPTIGVVIGAFFHLAIQIPIAFNLGFRYQPVFDFRLSQVKEIFRLMIPRTLGLAIYQLEATMAVFFATSFSAGSLTIFYLAQRLMDLPVRLFGTSIGQAALPTLSSQKAKGETELFRQTFVSSLSQILYLAFPAMVAILVLRIPLVRIAYGAKSFPWQATLLTGKVVALISLAIFSQSASQIIVRGFYAVHNTKVPLVIGFFSVLTNILLSLTLAFRLKWEILGLATAISFSSFLEAFLLLLFFQKKIGKLITREILTGWLKMIFASGISAVFFWLTMKVLDLFVFDTTRTVYLLTLTFSSGLIGFSVYFFLTRMMGLKESENLLEIIRRIKFIKKDISLSEKVVDDSGSAG